MRRYTVTEIDTMRDAIVSRLQEMNETRSYYDNCKLAEMRLRTYLEAGVDPEEIVERDHGKKAA